MRPGRLESTKIMNSTILTRVRNIQFMLQRRILGPFYFFLSLPSQEVHLQVLI